MHFDFFGPVRGAAGDALCLYVAEFGEEENSEDVDITTRCVRALLLLLLVIVVVVDAAGAGACDCRWCRVVLLLLLLLLLFGTCFGRIDY